MISAFHESSESHDESKMKKSAKPSGFKAASTANQDIPPNTPVSPILYNDVIFDLNNEYDPDLSTFSPKQDGVYSIIASVNFIPGVETDYRMFIVIRVKGIPKAGNNEFFSGTPLLAGDVVSVSTILQLAAGDTVTISTFSSTAGMIISNPIFTHFEAARFPSPLMND